MDFTLEAYRSLMTILLDTGYQMMPVSEYCREEQPENRRQLVLRHDVDRNPERSLAIANIESMSGVKGTYYFRVTPGSYDVSIIREIASQGHEIGYHYEDLDLVSRKSKAASRRSQAEGQKTEGGEERHLAAVAFESFKTNLGILREMVPIKTICMHGSPMSRHDSRLIWKYFDYGETGIESEPYFDLSLDDMLYLTDTGRRWDGSSVSVRDRVYVRDQKYYEEWIRKPVSGSAMAMTVKGVQLQKQCSFRKTTDVLTSAKTGRLPGKILLTVHPQRWSDSFPVWLSELLSQNLKNMVKYVINRRCFERGN